MKPSIQPSDSTGLSALFQHPPRISPSSPVLGSIIDLRANPIIAYSVFTAPYATTPSEQLLAVEAARRRIVSDYVSHPMLDSLLPSVHVTKDRVSLFVFAVGSMSEPSLAQATLPNLQLESLEQSESNQFTPDGIYPCSPACAVQLVPCSTCRQPVDAASPTSSQSSLSSQTFSSTILPRRPLRLHFSQFLQAVRDRLMDDATHTSILFADASTRTVSRLQNGILLSPPSNNEPNKWGTGWDHFSQTRPYVHCHLQIHLSQTQLFIQPIMRSTPYFALPDSIPLPPGTPIVLLPHGTPAYFLNVYSGPVGDLTRQFEDALVGLGCSNWKASLISSACGSSSTLSPAYIIAWLSVQNKQGEEKGLPLIWPTGLAVLPDNTPQSRQRLEHMPDLPPQLLASPSAVPVQAPPIRFPLSALNPPANLSTPFSQDEHSSSPHATVSYDEQPAGDHSRTLHVRLSCPSTSDSLRAFRSLAISRASVPSAARDVSMFVASVAHEREKERERLRRERDGSSSKIFPGPIRQQETDSAHSSPAVLKQEQDQEVESPAPHISFAHLSATAPSSQKTGDKVGLLPVWTPTQDSDALTQDGLFSPINGSPTVEVVKMEDSSDTPSVLPGTESQPESDNMAVDPPSSFDAFSGFAPSWNQSGNDFINIDMSLDNYNFDMSMNMSGGNDNETNNLGNEDGFALFTDDDFDFFDAPQSTMHTSAEGLAPVPTATLPGPTRSMQTSGPGPPSHLVHAIPATWVAQFAPEGVTPQSMAASTPGAAPPELLPSTPAQTPPSHSGPTTPMVLLADHDVHIRRGSTSSQGSTFDPIQFAPTHRALDDKYALGKFALPTPPPDEVERIWPIARRPADIYSSSGWKFSYGSVTDPGIGVMRRLVGINRKRLGEEHEKRTERVSPAWQHEHKEWAGCSVQSQEEQDSDSWSNSDVDNDEVPETESHRTPLSPFRSYTPPLSYLPLGPSLIQTGFHHSYLLPLSSALRPPGAVLAATTGPISVPTPVSPAATLGAASERTKALEAVAQLLIREIVENPIWADVWFANLIATHTSMVFSADVWPADIHFVSRIFGPADGLRSSPELKEIYQLDTSSYLPSFTELAHPMLSVGKSNALIQVLPSALRFWTKLGLRPRGGNKDVTAFVLFEGSSEAREEQAAEWLESVSRAYEVKNFGKHISGYAVGCTRDGIIPLQLDSLKKTLMSFIAGLSALTSSMVFYIVVPSHAVNLTSQLLRQIFSAIRKAKKTYADAPLLFHLVPESFLSGNLDDPTMRHRGFETLADAVYDRIPVTVKRMTARAFIPNAPRMQALFQEPAFALATPPSRKATFRLEAPPGSLDVLDRMSILHVGYQTSPCGKWLLAACVDHRGEMHEVKAWLIPSDGVEVFVTSSVCALVLHTAAKANVEWRIVIAKLGWMNELEIDAWNSQLPAVNRELPSSQVVLMVVDLDRPWNFLAPNHARNSKPPRSPSRTNKNSASIVLHDASTSTYLFHAGPNFFPLLDAPPSIVPAYPYIPDMEEDTPSPCIVRPISSATMVHVPAGTDHTSISMVHLHLLSFTRPPLAARTPSERVTLHDVAQNYHDLALLTKHRWRLRTSPILPFHLASLEIMGAALTSKEPFMD